jgi:exonuclease SbcD
VRLLHTSDWHLGRTLHGFSLGDAQAAAVDAVVATAIERDVDLVVVAGDVFDRAVPPIEALRVLNDALLRLSSAGIAVVIVSGNHDSGDRLATYAGLLQGGVHIVGSTGVIGEAVEVKDEHGTVVIYPVPYLDPDSARHELGEPGEPLERSHEAVMRAALHSIAYDLASRGSPRAVLVGHAFVVPSSDPGVDASAFSSESERDLTVGGVQLVPAALFDDRGLTYVALGHLHRPQQVRTTRPSMAYSGSLLRYSLSECGQAKSVVIVEIGASGDEPVLERIEIPQTRGMARLSDTIDNLIGPDYLEHREDFVELIVTDDAYPERMHARLDAVFPYALVKRHQPVVTGMQRGSGRGDARGRQPLDVIADFLRKVTGREPTTPEIDVLRSVYESVRAGD